MAMHGLRIGGGQPPVEDELMDQLGAASDPAVIPTEEEAPVLEDQSYGGGQVDPAIARYFAPEFMCANCIHFMEPGSCEIVTGEISPEGICSLHTPDAASMAPPEEELTEPIEELLATTGPEELEE